MRMATMPAVVQYGLNAGQVELREVPVPDVGEDEVLLKVGAVSVCGSDIHQYHATHSWPVNVPVILGHEFTGTVVATGNAVRGFHEGDRVVSETAARICGQCVYCRSGQYNVCPQRRGFGYGINGAMAGYVRAPARCLHPIPDELVFEVAALTEPSCVAYTAVVERTTIRPGSSVMILGPGLIGLLCMMMAKVCGAGTLVVTGLRKDSSRLELARQLGATHTLNTEVEDLAAFVRSLGDGYGVDVVIDATGVSAAFQSAMEVVRPLGQITKVGWGPTPLGASLDPIVQKAVTINGSFSHTYRTWERVIALLASGQLDVSAIAGLVTSMDQWQQAFEAMQSSAVAKAVLRP